jgi:general secretion pathway protein D
MNLRPTIDARFRSRSRRAEGAAVRALVARALLMAAAALLVVPAPATEVWAQENGERARARKKKREAGKTVRVRQPRDRSLRDRSRGERIRPLPGAAPAPGVTPPPSAGAPSPAAEAPEAPATAATPAPVPGEKEFNECLRLPGNRRVKFTLKQEADLTDLVAWISSMTCKKFIVATSLRAQKVTIVSPTPVTAAEAYRAFLSALEVMGLTVAPAGEYLKIVQGNWAIQASIPTYKDDERARIPTSDAVVTQLIRVANVDANELLLVLNKMKSRSGDVTSYKPTNMLIITDNALNVRRMLGIVKELDVATEGEKIWVIRLKHADVEEVHKILSQIFGQKAASPAPARIISAGRVRVSASPVEEDVSALSASKIVADPGTNSLIIVASATSFSRIASLIKKLDVETEGANQRINVYYLENGDAEQIANTLSGLTGGGVRPGGARGAARPVRQPGQAGQIASLFEGDVKVTADKATNALVIVASPKDFLNLRSVVKKLDIPRRQVFVEASILEITLDQNRKLGFAYHGGGTVGEGSSQSLIFGAVQHPEWSSLVINPLALMGLAVGARGQTIDGSGRLLGIGTDIPSFGVMFQALQNNSNVNVLSSPHILTTDNEQAEITVGQNIPFQGAFVGGMGSMAGAAGNLSSFLPTVSVQRQDVALKLKLTPHVNDSDMVRLELDQEVSDIASQNFNGLGPATSKRTAKTTVVVRDQQTVVIGGLMGNRIQNVVSKVPLLGDIPILGYFFKHTAKTVQKTNLLIVLTPYVIRDQTDLRRIFRKKLEERRDYIRRYTNFSTKELSQDIDYRHKRGLLSEISKVGEAAEQEQKLLEESKKRGVQDTIEGVDMPQGMGPKTRPSSSPPPDTSSGDTSIRIDSPSPPPARGVRPSP